jgi:four helix bundle protein
MSNIAEGFARKSDKEFARFLDMARGSAIEVQSLLYVALDVHYMDGHQFERLHRLADEAASLIGGLTSYLRGARRSPESVNRRLGRITTIRRVPYRPNRE